MAVTGGKPRRKKAGRKKKAGRRKKKSTGAKTLGQKRAVVARSSDPIAKRMLNKATQKAYTHARKHAAAKKRLAKNKRK